MTDISTRVQELAGLLLQKKFFLSTAESCTGGLIGHLLTNQPGSSAWYMGGAVAYSNSLKIKILGVNQELLYQYGAVSSECVLGMARGVSDLTGSQVSVAVSGIAGPDGGTPDKPVGTVYIAWGGSGDFRWEKNIFSGDRHEVKFQSAERAIETLVRYLLKMESQ